MGKKLTYEFVKLEVENRGWDLISKEYVNSDTKLDFICNRGHKNSIRWRNFKKIQGCIYCKKPTINFIRDAFNKKGYILLSTEYKDNKTRLDYKCKKCNNNHSICWSNFQQGRGCPHCSKHVKPTLEFIKQEFLKKDFELLSTEYKNNMTKLKFLCKKCGVIQNKTWSGFLDGCGCFTCFKKNRLGKGSPYYKGGVDKLNLPLYNTFAPKLEKYEQTHLIRQNDLDLLGVNCLYCGKVFVPTTESVRGRLKSAQNINKGEARFYCSESCKQACPTFGQILYPKGFKHASSREMQPQFRKMVLERDNWTCQKCGASKDIDINTELHAHHIDPVINNPIESCDVDNGITLCIDCHQEVHKLPGCSLNELKCPSGAIL